MNTYLTLTILTLFRPNEQKMIIIIKKSRIGTVQVHSEIWYMKRHTIESSTKRSKREREVTNHCSLSWWRRRIWEGSWSWSRSSSSSSSMPLQRSNSSLLVANFFDIFSLRFSFFVSPNPTQAQTETETETHTLCVFLIWYLITEAEGHDCMKPEEQHIGLHFRPLLLFPFLFFTLSFFFT